MGGSTTFTDTLLINNGAMGDGGGADGVSLMFHNCTMKYNAAGHGGALHGSADL